MEVRGAVTVDAGRYDVARDEGQEGEDLTDDPPNKAINDAGGEYSNNEKVQPRHRCMYNTD